MITKITNTPSNFAMTDFYTKNDCCKPRKASPINSNIGLNADTVSFTSAKKTQDIVTLAFRTLSETRNGKSLGKYIGKVGKTDIYLEEKDFAKKAELTIIRNNGFANFEISRSIGKPGEIKSLDENGTSGNIISVVKRYLKLDK